MARIIRFPLIMRNKVEVRTLEELRDNYDRESVLEYYANGKLQLWLSQRYYDDLAQEISLLDKDDTLLNQKICGILGVDFQSNDIDNSNTDIGVIENRLKKKNILREKIDDPVVLDSIDSVAFDQDELNILINKGFKKIYLYDYNENSFKIPLKEDTSFIGINKPVIVFADGHSKSEYDILGVSFKNVCISVKPRQEEDREYEGAIKKYLKCEFDQAYDIFICLGEKRYPRAMYYIGEYYDHGYGHIIKNKEKAVEWRKKGYELGDCLASVNYAVYSLSENSELSRIILRNFNDELKRMAEDGDMIAQYELAYLYFGGYGVLKQETEGIKWLRKSAGNGFFRAINNIGDCYYNGNHVGQDYSEAVRWYKKGVEIGYRESFTNMGFCYYLGKGVMESNIFAYEWFEKGYNLGDGYAARMISRMYAKGHVCELSFDSNYDSKKSLEWIKKSAELGCVSGQVELADIYYNGQGTSKDDEKAKKWYKEASDNGDDYSCTQLGIIYLEEKNYSEAVKYFKIAAERGYPEAQHRLGCRYDKGQGVKEDKAEAFKWFKMAANKGNMKAQAMVGQYYFVGTGVKQDMITAKEWAEKSAKQGWNYGKDLLKEILDSLNQIEHHEYYEDW